MSNKRHIWVVVAIAPQFDGRRADAVGVHHIPAINGNEALEKAKEVTHPEDRLFLVERLSVDQLGILIDECN